jgi:CcmD family protein
VTKVKHLQFLFFAYAAIWGFIFVYILFMGQKQQKLAQELRLLKKAVGEEKEE